MCEFLIRPNEEVWNDETGNVKQYLIHIKTLQLTQKQYTRCLIAI